MLLRSAPRRGESGTDRAPAAPWTSNPRPECSAAHAAADRNWPQRILPAPVRFAKIRQSSGKPAGRWWNKDWNRDQTEACPPPRLLQASNCHTARPRARLLTSCVRVKRPENPTLQVRRGEVSAPPSPGRSIRAPVRDDRPTVHQASHLHQRDGSSPQDSRGNETRTPTSPHGPQPSRSSAGSSAHPRAVLTDCATGDCMPWAPNLWRSVRSVAGNPGHRNGGPGGIRTLDLLHAMEARSQLRHRPTNPAWVQYTTPMR